MQTKRHVKLFRNGRNQAIRIPREFEMEGNEAIISKEKNKLIVEPVDRYYAKLSSHLDKEGRLIGPNDMLIAAHSLSLGLTLVTANERKFLRVPDLGVENWLA